jgi:hypothetical protein
MATGSDDPTMMGGELSCSEADDSADGVSALVNSGLESFRASEGLRLVGTRLIEENIGDFTTANCTYLTNSEEVFNQAKARSLKNITA